MAYLGLAAWGAVHPSIHHARFLSGEGMGLPDLFAAWGANAATVGLAWDLAIAGTAFVVWVVAETRVRRNWTALVAIPATLVVGLSFALPLYLFLRTRPVA